MKTLLDSFADVLSYPSRTFQQSVATVSQELARREDTLHQKFSAFVDYAKKSTPTELEETYIKTFDIQAPCYLEVGYVLFGEDYKRGHFLVKMQGLHRQAGHDCKSELPDFLPNILELLSLLPSENESAELVGKLVLPAMEKMIPTLSADHIYRSVLEIICDVLKSPLALEYYQPSLSLPSYPSGSSERAKVLGGEEEFERSQSW